MDRARQVPEGRIRRGLRFRAYPTAEQREALGILPDPETQESPGSREATGGNVQRNTCLPAPDGTTLLAFVLSGCRPVFPGMNHGFGCTWVLQECSTPRNLRHSGTRRRAQGETVLEIPRCAWNQPAGFPQRRSPQAPERRAHRAPASRRVIAATESSQADLQWPCTCHGPRARPSSQRAPGGPSAQRSSKTYLANLVSQ